MDSRVSLSDVQHNVFKANYYSCVEVYTRVDPNNFKSQADALAFLNTVHNICGRQAVKDTYHQ